MCDEADLTRAAVSWLSVQDQASAARLERWGRDYPLQVIPATTRCRKVLFLNKASTPSFGDLLE